MNNKTTNSNNNNNLVPQSKSIIPPKPQLTRNISFYKTTASLSPPSLLIQNYCGAKLSISLSIPHQRGLITSINIASQNHARIDTPWEFISKNYGDQTFPTIQLTVSLFNNITNQDFSRQYPLHSLSIEKVFIQTPLFIENSLRYFIILLS